MWGMHEGIGWWMVFGGVWMVAFLAIVLGLVALGVGKASGGKERRREMAETPMEIAQIRLARGEVTREEFDELSDALREKVPVER